MTLPQHLLHLYAILTRELPPRDATHLFYPISTDISKILPSKRVHMTAINGSVGKTHYRELRSFIERNDDYYFFFWDDFAAYQFMEAHFWGEPIFQIYQQCQHGIMRADIFRLCVLFIYGGWYFDLKSQFRVELANIPLSSDTLYLVSEANKAEIESPLLNLHASGHIIANWFMATPQPKLLQIKNILDFMVKAFPQFDYWREQYGFVRAVWETTGPRMLTRYFVSTAFAEKVHIFDSNDARAQPIYACRGARTRTLIHRHYTAIN